MSCKQKRGIRLFLFAAAGYFYTFLLCCSVTFGQSGDDFIAYRVQESASTRWGEIKQHRGVKKGRRQPVEDPNLRKSNQPGLHELRPDSSASPREPFPHLIFPKPDKTGIEFAPNTLSWTIGNVSTISKSSAPEFEDGYQADFTGFHGVQGKVSGLSSDLNPHFSEWQAMKPLVECDDNVMTFTASGQEFTHLLVDREGASPISVFQLPPYCGYSVRTSWSDLEMMVPYDACYITQENGSYVLPMLWWGIPVKLSCPMQMSTPGPSFSLATPSVFCSPHGMAVQIQGQDLPMLGVIVNGVWSPFVSEQCAYLFDSQFQEFTFFISDSAPCISTSNGLHLQLVLDDQEYILSCPVTPQFSSIPSPRSPGDPQFPYILDPVSPAPTPPPPPPSPPPPPQPPTQDQIAQLPDYPHYPDPGLQYPQLPRVYPPGPQPARLPHPTPGSPPGLQQQQKQEHLQQFFSHVGPGKDRSPDQVSKLPFGSSQYPFNLYYPNVPFYYPAVSPAPTPAAQKNTNTTPTVLPATQLSKTTVTTHHSQYYLQIPYYPAPTGAPVTQAPAPAPHPLSPQAHPLTLLKQSVDPQYEVSPYYPFVSYRSYYSYWPPTNSKPSASHPATALPLSPKTATAYSPRYPSGQFYFHRPPYLNLPTLLPPAKVDPQKPVTPHTTCLPYTHAVCSYYSYYPYYHTLYPPHYRPTYAPVPQYPEIQPPMPTTMPFTTSTLTPSTPSFTSPAWPTPQTPHLQCLMGRLVVYLPYAHPDSIQVRDQTQMWLFLSSVSPLCGYAIQTIEGSGVILQSPLPACQSQLQTPTTISLPVRFWDLSIGQYRTLDLQCPYQSTPETPEPLVPSVSLTSTSKNLPAVPKAKVFCSSHQMTVVLPSGPISEIVVKDIKGNQMNLQEAPKHCGYSVGKGKDGKIHLRLKLHSRCHMSVQGKMYIITVVYMTVRGRREAQFSCPLVILGSGHECNLPSEQRLPCGPSSVSQPHCLSMGCCFNKHPPACYYPMDECTIDRHFVFSVPASLTEPPLSPAQLVAASNSTCKPQRVTSDYALFKIPLDGCGTRRVVVGKTVVYMVEIINKVQTLSLNYGTITRDSPVRLLVECRFVPGTVLTVSYVVKTPTLGPEVHTQGVFGVQLRIAKDVHYSSYYPQYHQPLQMLLGKPLYLEVRLLNSPDPSLVLLVHFCVAYPRSGKAVWVLLYNGCPNPLDPASSQAMLPHPQPPTPQGQVHRFTINTFQFLPDGEFKDPDEEIYFMCSTEICSPRDGPCIEGCFGQ